MSAGVSGSPGVVLEHTCHRIRVCAISTSQPAPWRTTTVGMFLDYVARRPNGVLLSALGHPAWARDAHIVEFAGSSL
jgi:hypothetical protein